MLERGRARECFDGSLESSAENELVQLLKLGLICTAEAPSRRPSMAEVVQFLEVFLPLPDRRQRRPSSFRSSTTTAIPSRSATTAAILLPICDDSGYPPSDLPRQRLSSFRSATTAAIDDSGHPFPIGDDGSHLLPFGDGGSISPHLPLQVRLDYLEAGADVLITASYQEIKCYIVGANIYKSQAPSKCSTMWFVMFNCNLSYFVSSFIYHRYLF
ncbi:hypothetical protein Taro_027615 [Colocasia esculenta]|uniref:Uncharacterized protein n=1 Tax=Colocasia esculenta TaxID=4460 RepID=A0A843VG69_COLES|nr:hypothetical protein [Colocasia esculenta]